jgi:multidrug efflux pump subunit AcrA (membrane-fusion protein)
MAFVNLPPNLQDMFYVLGDRIMKLETGPNQAMYTAEYAQGVAESAQGGSLTAQTTAAAALAQSTIAQAQATSAQALASAANTTASTASAQATQASAQAATAQATANTAMLQATVASAQAITAQNTANSAASQATTAQSTANIANTNATIAQATANGKSKVTYSTSAPGTTANSIGDIWYQYGTVAPYVNKVIAQFSGNGGTSWTPVTVSGLVIANIDAGAITTGTLQAITISAGSGGNAFNVSSTGVMSAQGAWIKGNITADSGTFNGQVNAQSGYFGNLTNGWRIDTNGITGLGSGYISGGAIQGTSFNNGNGTFFVNSSGQVVAQSIYAKGAILGTSGYFGTATNGWQIDSNGITGLGSGYIAGGAIQGTSFNNGNGTFFVNAAGSLVAQNVYVKGAVLGTSGYFGNASNGWNIDSAGITGIGSGYIAGGAIQGTTLTGGIVQTSTGSSAVIMNGSSNAIQFKTSGTVVGNIVPLSSFGVLTHYGATPDPSGGTFPQMFVGSTNCSISASPTRSIGVATTGIDLTGPTSLNGTVTYPGVATGAGTTMVVVTTGSRVAIVTSSERFKEQIQYVNAEGWLDKVLAMKPITYKTSTDFTTEGEPNELQYGFLAEDVYDLGGGLEKAVILDPLGDPFSLSYDRLTVFLTLAIKELKAEIDQIKGA